MAATGRGETNKRLNRLAGSGQGSGGGLPLPGLFAAMLNEVLDNAPVSTDRMTEIASSVLAFKQQAVFATWPTWEALAADVLAQLESRKIIERDGESWIQGPKLLTGQRIEIIPARPGVGSKSDGVTVWTKEARDARSSADHAIRTFGALDAEVAQRGSRRVTTARKELILESMRQLGDLRDYFPVLLDEQGNVVDGRHRREIDPNWPASRTRVPLEKRLAAAAAANRTNAWTERDWKALLDQVTETTGRKTGAVRTLIRLALLEDASRSDRAIAALIGCDGKTVASVRADLEANAEIPHYIERTTASGTAAPGAKPSTRQVPDETKEAVIREAERRLAVGEPTDFRGLADQFGVGQPFVQQCIAIAKDRLDRADQQPAQEAQPETAEPTPAPRAAAPSMPSRSRPRPKSLAQRLTRLLTLLEADDSDDDPVSELEELDALRREIDERIEALRR